MSTPAKIHFNADTVQKPEDKVVKEPFVAHVGDRDIVFTDPNDLTWQDLLEVDTVIQVLNYAVTEDDRDFLLNYKMEGWKFNKMVEDFLKHYKFELPPRDGTKRTRF